jgi:hypothetical protein
MKVFFVVCLLPSTSYKLQFCTYVGKVNPTSSWTDCLEVAVAHWVLAAARLVKQS